MSVILALTVKTILFYLELSFFNVFIPNGHVLQGVVIFIVLVALSDDVRNCWCEVIKNSKVGFALTSTNEASALKKVSLSVYDLRNKHNIINIIEFCLKLYSTIKRRLGPGPAKGRKK